MGRYIEKRVNLRVEHVKHSACRQEFLDRVKSNAAKKREAKAKGEYVNLKRDLLNQEELLLFQLKKTFHKHWPQFHTKPLSNHLIKEKIHTYLFLVCLYFIRYKLMHI